MQTIRSTTQYDATVMAFVLIMSALASTLVASIGVVNYLNGDLLRSSISLLAPAFLSYWAWKVRANLNSEPLIPILSIAWLTGLPIGWAVYAVRHLVN